MPIEGKRIQSDPALYRSEIKVLTIKNGYILKSRDGWESYSSLDPLMDAIRKKLTPGGEINA